MQDKPSRSVEEIIRERASLRRFADSSLLQEDVDWIVEGAMRAPTAGNMMLCSMILVRDPVKKQVLSETCDHQPFSAKAPLVIIFVAENVLQFKHVLNASLWLLQNSISDSARIA